MGSAQASEQFSIGGPLRKIRFSLIKDSMLGGLHLARPKVKVDDVAMGLLTAKEDALTVAAQLSILKNLLLLLLGSVKGKETAAKDPQVSHVRDLSRLQEAWRMFTSSMRDHVVETQEVMKGKGPELGLKSSTSQHGTQGILDGAMRTLSRTIGGGGIRSCGLNGVASTLKQFIHFSAAAKFTHVPAHTLASTIAPL